MKKTIKENSKNYVCSVVKIETLYPILDADRIQRTVILGNNVVVSKETNIGDVVLYFNSGTQLNSDFCYENDLFDKAELNKNNNKGYISYKQRRIKAIKLKGIISDGIVLPITSLSNFCDIFKLNVGDTFTDIDDFNLCEKYFIPVRENSNIKKSKQSVKINRIIDKQFYLHVDTDNLRRNIDKINPMNLISINYKKHGTSVVIGNVLVNRKLNFLEKVLDKLGVKIHKTEYDTIYSSRKVIKNGYLNSNPNSYYSTDIWGDVANEVKSKIPKGYAIYGEILGYTKDGAYIQKNYDYKCLMGEHSLYVYRMTYVNEDGYKTEMSDLQILEFCNKNGLNFRNTLIYYGYAKDLYPEIELDENWGVNFLNKLEKNYNEKDCYMCDNKVPEEGIILRVESGDVYEVYKLKSKRFLLMESEEQEKEIVNIEDSQE